MTESILRLVQLAPQAGRSFLVGPNLFTIKATADDTGGAYTLFVGRMPLGGGPPPHIHHLEDIALLVLEGTYAITVGEATARYGPGGFVFIPRGTILACENVGESPARLLFVVTPGGLQEQYFAEFGQLVADPEVDLPAAPANLARMLAVAEQYGIEFVHPTIGT
jgi:quercetin dioxygenase-like cupin family protein